MKKLMSILLVAALALGFVPNLASVNAVAESSTLTVTCSSGAETAIGTKASENGKSLSDYTGLVLNYDGKTLSSSDWAYIRSIFSGDSTNLKTLKLGGTLNIIPACSDNVSPLWESVTLPETLTTIGNNAFRKSTELKEITIPKDVKSIGALVFAGCTSLTDIKIDSSNSIYKNLNGDGVIYADNFRNLHTYPAGKTATEYKISAGVTKLGIGSFADVQITDMIIPVGVEAILDAFVKTPGVEAFALSNIYFNRATPPNLSLGGLSKYDNVIDYKEITIYAPPPSINTYKNNSNYKKFNEDIGQNGGDDAEILGLKIQGTVSAGEDSDSGGEEGDPEPEPEEEETYNFYTGGANLDLLTEKITLDVKVGITGKNAVDFVVEGYSLNGTSWVAGTLEDLNTKLEKALNSATVIKLSNRFDTSTKKPKTDSDIITFPAVQGRPKSNLYRFKLYYEEENWGLVIGSETDFSEKMDEFTYVTADDKGKLPTTLDWKPLPGDGLKIDDYPAKGVKKTAYYLRSSAFIANDMYYPNGKPWKVTPATRSKAPKYKVNYKKELIKIKKGDVIVGNDETKGTKMDFSVTDLLDNGTESITLVKLPTGKKPGSMSQTLELAKRGAISKSSFTVDKGKIKDKELKLYEFSTNGTTWGRIPKFSSSNEVYIRLKQNVKIKNGVIYSGFAASDPARLAITWDVYDSDKNKSGIIGAVISAGTATPEPTAVVFTEDVPQEEPPVE